MSGVTVFGCRPDVLGVVEREALRLGLSATTKREPLRLSDRSSAV